MDILTPLNLTMFTVMVGTFLCTRRLFKYRNMLKQALLFTTTPVVQQQLGNTSAYKESEMMAKEEHATYDVLWVPVSYVTFAAMGLLWLGLSYGMDSVGFGTVVALAVSALVTRSVTFKLGPSWLTDWMVNMMDVINQSEYEKATARFQEIVKRTCELAEIVGKGKELSDTEQAEIVGFVIETAYIRNTLQNVEDTIASIAIYRAHRGQNTESAKAD